MTILVSSVNKLIRKRWIQILEDEYQVLEVFSVAELKKIAQQQSVDLILLHRSMVDMDFISRILTSRFFVLSDVPNDNEAISLLRLGVVGYANTYVSPVRLKEAVHVALSGRVWVGQQLMQKVINGTTSSLDEKQTEMPPQHNLSDREWEVALLVGQGKSNLEIAADLNISESTVKAHISSIFKKTKTESRLQLALHVKALLT